MNASQTMLRPHSGPDDETLPIRRFEPEEIPVDPRGPDDQDNTVVDFRSPWYDFEAQAESLLEQSEPRAHRSNLAEVVELHPRRSPVEPAVQLRAEPEPVAEPEPTAPLERKPNAKSAPVDLGYSTLPPPNAWWRRMWKGERLMHYNRLIILSLVGNAVLLYLAVTSGLLSGSAAERVGLLSDLVLLNFAVAILIRQHHVINFLFWVATSAPTWFPLSIRRTLAKVYHFGGIHVGTAIAGSLWYLALVATMLSSYGDPSLAMSSATLGVAIAQAVVLTGICVFSRPSFRTKHHDAFELIKRFGGWTSLALLWAQTALTTADRLPAGASLSDELLYMPQVWLLAIITFSVALPWLRLKKVPVVIDTPSDHVAIARFHYGVTPFAGSSTAISRSPLTEWHSFANIPSPGEEGYRLAISRAGDWTGKLIDDEPSHVWVKGVPTAGVANIEVLFKKVVYVATGSGIGPCLPHLLANEVPAHLVWATRDPRKTYGDGLVDEILAEHPDALLWDTDDHGKPDLVELAYRAVQETGAEAVICISNKKLTWRVVSGMESRGIPAYGAIWDS